MEKNIKEKISNYTNNKLEKTNYSNYNLKSANGITLIALVITIIVLLILAGVSLSMVLSQDGIFSRAEQATDKYGQSKARETLELVLGEVQMTKYEEGLSGENYENRLDEKIEEVGSLIPKDDENSIYQLVIVDGHIFEVDRSVPKIVDYKGPANGVIVTARIKQNGWTNSTASATVTGTITKYGGGSVVSTTVTATNGITIPADFPTTGGSYTISNITTDTEITITTTDSEGQTATKTIPVVLVRDNTPPVISEQTATANMMKITISARAVDNESGLASLTYKIEPNTIKDGKATGTLTSGTPIEVEATAVGNYTITFTAKDVANNTSTATAGPVRASDAMSVADLKEKINGSNYPDYLGTKVDYNPEAGGTWRVFYYDASGEYGDGAGTIYLKRDYETTTTLSSYTPADGGALMRQLNPKWAAATNGSAIDLENEHCVAWLCDSSQWTRYKTAEAKYAIGGAPIEMWCKAQNAYKNKYDTSASTIGCDIKSANGYGYTINGGSLVDWESTTVVSNINIQQSAVIATGIGQWLASPSSNGSYGYGVCSVDSNYVSGNYYGDTLGVCPVVSLNH